MENAKNRKLASFAKTEHEPTRTGLSPETLARALRDNLYYAQGRVPEVATPHDWYAALAYTVRDRLLQRWIKSVQTLMKQDIRVVSYLSAEFLMGPHLGNALINLGIVEEARQAVAHVGLDLNDLLEQEEEPGLGNGGLGRLAACFLDSLATLEVPAIGYGIRYEFGIFDQDHSRRLAGGDHRQVAAVRQPLGTSPVPRSPTMSASAGIPKRTTTQQGEFRVRWAPGGWSKALHTTPRVLGYGVNTANLAALVEGGGRRVLRLRGLQRGRLLRGRGREDQLGEHHQGALSERRALSGQAAAPRTAVLFRLLFSARHDPHPSSFRKSPGHLRRARWPCSSTTPIPPSRWRS